MKKVARFYYFQHLKERKYLPTCCIFALKKRMFDLFNVPYYLIIGLQGICVFHCVKRGNQGKWVWIIVCLPVVGSLIYIFSEIITKRDMGNVQSNISTLIFPTGRVKDLKKKLEFANTFDNKVGLADAYLREGSIQEAIELYESCLVGVFSDNEYVITKLIISYYHAERYQDAVKMGQKILKSADFNKSHAHILYALSLEKAGNAELAEKELKSMQGTYSNFEARLNYGQFLIRASRSAEAKVVFSEILQEASHMNSRESRNNSKWFKKTREELSAMRN